jgi:hypothetical protein
MIAQLASAYPVSLLCELLELPRSSYYYQPRASPPCWPSLFSGSAGVALQHLQSPHGLSSASEETGFMWIERITIAQLS